MFYDIIYFYRFYYFIFLSYSLFLEAKILSVFSPQSTISAA